MSMTLKRETLLVLSLAVLAAVAYSATAAAQTGGTSSSSTEVKKGGGGATNEIEVLRRQLAAQKAINEQLRQRVQVLEKRLSATGPAGGAVTALDVGAAKPSVEPETKKATTAIEEALVSKGLVLIPFGQFRFVPNVSWAHSGKQSRHMDSFMTGLGFDAGLPWGMMASVNVPYVWRDYYYGSNDGIGDISLTLRKKLTNETAAMPSLVASATYIHDTGADPFSFVPVGSGFRSLKGSLAAYKRFDPLVFNGDIFYQHAFGDTVTLRDSAGRPVFRGRIAPGDDYGFDAGVSLAATPAISLDAGLSFAFYDSTRYEPTGARAFDGSRATAGYMTLGSGFLLSNRLFLSLDAAAGVTDDASDFVFSMAMPYRF